MGIRVQLNEMQRELYFERSDMTDRMVGGNDLRQHPRSRALPDTQPLGAALGRLRGVADVGHVAASGPAACATAKRPWPTSPTASCPAKNRRRITKNLFNLLERRLQTVMGSPGVHGDLGDGAGLACRERAGDRHGRTGARRCTSPTRSSATFRRCTTGRRSGRACLFYDSQQLFYKE